MTLKRQGQCACGAAATLEISAEGWDAVPPWFQLTATCAGTCPVTHETMTADQIDATGWRYDGPTGRWSRLVDTSVEGWVP